jgi:hypothetical protein
MSKILQKTAVFTLLLFLFSYALPPAAAQNYQFAVPEMILQAYIQPDASVEFVYDIHFSQHAGRPGHRHCGHRHATQRLRHWQHERQHQWCDLDRHTSL